MGWLPLIQIVGAFSKFFGVDLALVIFYTPPSLDPECLFL